MMLYVNTHAALEQMRKKAEDEETRGPRVRNLRTHWFRACLVAWLVVEFTTNMYDMGYVRLMSILC